MSRVQLALNVDDLEQAVTFYTKLFGAEPAKRRPGYANFAIAEPPLKLVLLENPGQGGPSSPRRPTAGPPAADEPPAVIIGKWLPPPAWRAASRR